MRKGGREVERVRGRQKEVGERIKKEKECGRRERKGD